MSYILEAIKKAESERGDSRLYGNSYVEDSPKVARKISWAAIAIFLNVAILLIWIAFQSSHNPVNEKEGKERLEVESSVEYAKVPTVAVNSEIIIDKPAAGELKNEPVSPEEPTDPDVLSAAVNTGKPDFISKFAKVRQEPNEVDNVTKANTIDKKASKAKVEPLHIVDNLEPGEDKYHLINQETEKNELPVVVRTMIETPVIENPNVPEITELPYSLQKSIPELVLSVHIYNIVKNARKVRINGKLLREGDAVSNGLSIQEITPYGVVFKYSGELFKVNLH
tara:strand:+ start:1050 stop:1895 length:846 start_codon:yes stop_codon:yes gene_type:complete